MTRDSDSDREATGSTHNGPPVSIELEDAAAELLNAMVDTFETRLAEADMTASEVTTLTNFLRETGHLASLAKNQEGTPDE